MEALSRNWGWLLACGILMIILGIFAIGAPVVATIAFQVVLGWLLVIGGIAEGIHAFMAQNWRGFLFELLSAILYLLLASGILSLILGAMIWAQWPASGAWVIGLLVGIQLLFTGWSLVMLALAARSHRQAMAPAT
jgi:uncharacterized membrane protein HdeD (DUF308 family)